MFDLGNWIRGIFGKKDDEENRQQSQQPQQPQRFQNFDASKLTNVTNGANNQSDLTENRSQQRSRFALPESLGVMTPTRSQSFSTNQQKAMDERLDKGASWEDIARDTGLNVDTVRQYSRATRPDYGLPQNQIEAKKELSTAINDTRGDWGNQKTLIKDNASTDELNKAKQEVLDVQQRQRMADEALGDEVGELQLSFYGNQTPRQFFDNFNAMDATGQRETVKRLTDNVANNQMDFGSKDASQLRDQSILLLNLIEDRGQKKEDISSRLAEAGEIASGMVTEPIKGIKNVIRSGQVLAGQDLSAPIEADLREGRITKEEYIHRMNQLQNELSEFTGGMQDRGALDQAMRAAGTAVDITSAVAPVLSTLKGVKGVRNALNASEQITHSIPETIMREAGLNAALGAGGALREGTDITPEGVVGETLASAAIGGAMAGAGAGAAKFTDSISQNLPRTMYRGAPEGENASFVTPNKAMAEEFAQGTNGVLASYNMAPKDMLDVSRRDDLVKVQNLVGEAETEKLLSKTPGRLFSPEDEIAAHDIASKLGYKGVKFDERTVGMAVPDLIKDKPYSYGIIDQSALTEKPNKEAGFIRLPFSDDTIPSPSKPLDQELSNTGAAATPDGRAATDVTANNALEQQYQQELGQVRTEAQLPEEKADAYQNNSISGVQAAPRYSLTPEDKQQLAELKSKRQSVWQELAPTRDTLAGMDRQIEQLDLLAQQKVAENDPEGAKQVRMEHADAVYQRHLAANRERELARSYSAIKEDEARIKRGPIQPGAEATIEPSAPKGVVMSERPVGNTGVAMRKVMYPDPITGKPTIREEQYTPEARNLEESVAQGKVRIFEVEPGLADEVQRGNDETYKTLKERGLVGEYVIDKGVLKRRYSDQEGNSSYKRVRNAVITNEDGNIAAAVTGGKFVESNEVAKSLSRIDSWKNKGTFTKNIDRILESAAPSSGDYLAARKFLIEPREQAVANMTKDWDAINAEHKAVIQSLRVKGQKLDAVMADLQNYGEQKLSRDDLVKKYGEDLARRIDEAVVWYRNTFDTLLDRANNTLKQFGYDPIPKRKDYFTHFRENDTWSKFGVGIENMLHPTKGSLFGDLQVNAARGAVPESMVGKTAQLTPGKKFNQFALRRRGNEYTAHAGKSLEAYLPNILNNIHLTESIARGRTFEKMLEVANKDRGTLSRLMNGLRQYNNSLAGKSATFDRAVIDNGYKGIIDTLGVMQGLRGRSAILGNLGSALMQTSSLPQIYGVANPKNFALAALQQAGHIRDKANDPLLKSRFMQIRYGNITNNFRGKLAKAEDVLSKPLEFVEKAVTEIAWRAMYNKALSEGKVGDAAILEADRLTSRTVGSRNFGDRSELMRTKTFGMFTQFKLEVYNTAQQITSKGGELNPLKHPVKFANYAIAAAALGYVLEQVLGRQPLLSPITAAIDAYNGATGQNSEYGNGPIAPFNVAADTLAQNLPFGPEAIAGAQWALGTANSNNELFKGSDTDKYGYSNTISSTIRPVASFVTNPTVDNAVRAGTSFLPAGGQVNKSYQGITTMQKGVAESGDKVQTVVDDNDPLRWLQAFAFGKNAIPEVRDFNKNGSSALNEDQSQYIRDLPGGARKAAFDKVTNANATDKAEADERKKRKEELKAGKTQINPTDASTGSLKDRAKQLKTDSEILKKSVEDLRKENNLPDSVDSYEKIVAHLSNNYEDYVEAYGLKPNDAKIGSGKFSSLVSDTTQKDIYRIARNLYQGEGQYADIPDDIKNAFYAKNKLNSNEVEYDAYTQFPTASKAKFLTESISNQSYDEKIKTLTSYRRESYSGDQFANDKAIDLLVDAGLISKEDGKSLKAITVKNDGTVSKKKGSSSKVKGLKVPDYNISLPDISKASDFLSGMPSVSVGSSFANVKVKGIKAPGQITVKQEPLKRLAVRS